MQDLERKNTIVLSSVLACLLSICVIWQGRWHGEEVSPPTSSLTLPTSCIVINFQNYNYKISLTS